MEKTSFSREPRSLNPEHQAAMCAPRRAPPAHRASVPFARAPAADRPTADAPRARAAARAADA